MNSDVDRLIGEVIHPEQLVLKVSNAFDTGMKCSLCMRHIVR